MDSGVERSTDQFAEAHLSAPALFTLHLGSERRASQELSCSHNTATSHTGQRRRGRRGGCAYGGLRPATPRPLSALFLFIVCSSYEDCSRNLISVGKGSEWRGPSVWRSATFRLWCRRFEDGFPKMKAGCFMKGYFKPNYVNAAIFIDLP